MRKLFVFLTFLVIPSANGTLWGQTTKSLAPRRVAERLTGPADSQLLSAARETEAAASQIRRLLKEGDTGSPLKTSRLRTARNRLAQLDRKNAALFREIEENLVAAGLSGKVEDWRAFVRNYQAGIEDLRSNSGSETAANSTPEERSFIVANRQDALPAHPPRPFATAGRSLIFDGPPLPEDLAESKLVQLTPDIRAKAAELGKSPERIFDFVHNNYEYILYDGALQNSQAIFWSRQGNSLDQSTLLIALLRASGIPARYEYIGVPITNETAMSWLGVKTPDLAYRLIHQTIGSELIPGGIQMYHVRVRAYLGSLWIGLDPSMKLHEFQSGVVEARPAFDRNGFINAGKNMMPSYWYLDQVRQSILPRYPGKGLAALGYTGRIAPSETLSLPPPPLYTSATLFGQESEIDPKLHYRLAVSILRTVDDKTPLATINVSIPETCLQSLTLGFTPATAADRQALAMFSGAGAIPFGFVKLTPQIALDGKVVVSNATVLDAGAPLLYSNALYTPNQTTPLYTDIQSIVAGDTMAVGLDSHQISEHLLDQRAAALLNMPSLADTSYPANATGELLSIAALRYFQRVRQERQRITGPMQVYYYSFGPPRATTFASLNVQKLFDRPFVVTPGRVVIDVTTGGSFYDLNTKDGLPEVAAVAQAEGLTSSAMENVIWEELVLVPTISTSRALQIAAQSRIPIRTITKANLDAELVALQASSRIKDNLRTDVTNGRTIIIPQRPVTFGKWTGFGWISEKPTGVGDYIIASGLNGGDSGGFSPEPKPTPVDNGEQGNQSKTNRDCVGAPVTISNGNMFHQFDDLNIRSRGMPLKLTRTYNSQDTRDGPFGFGWAHNYGMSLRVSTTAVVFADDSGGQFAFARQGDTFTGPPALNASMRRELDLFVLRYKDGLELRFGADGKLISLTDRNGNQHQLKYDSTGLLTSLQDAMGAGATFTYDSRKHITSFRDHTGRTVTYTYDAKGNLTRSADFSGAATSYEYYLDVFNDHALKVIRWPEGGAIVFEYYGNRRASRIIYPGGAEQRFLYDPMQNETTVVDERGFATTHVYNGFGNVVRIYKPDGNVIDQEWTADAKLASRTDEAGLITRYQYDPSGNLLSVTNPAGGVVRFTYESRFNQVTSVTDARGYVTRFEYDVRGNRTRTTDALGSQTNYVYDSFGQLTNWTDPEGNSFRIGYDAQGNPVESRDAQGSATAFRYDSLRRLIGVVDALNNEQRLEYDAMDRRTKRTDPLGKADLREYDRNGNLVREVDRSEKATTYSYDLQDNLAQLQDASGNVTQYNYTDSNCSCAARSSLTSLIDTTGAVWSQSYTALRQLDRSRDPAGVTRSSVWDARGNLAAKTDGNGQTIVYAYEALGRLASKTYPDGSQAFYGWDANGNLISTSNADIALTYTYDELNRLKSVTDNRFDKTIKYTYDRNGRRTTMVDPDGGIRTYGYGKNGLLTSITNPSGDTITITYDALGRRNSLVRPNGVATNYEYDAAGRLLSLTHLKTAGNTVVSQFTYTYDRSGNRLSVKDLEGVHDYQYDDNCQLIAAHHPATDEAYSYDSVGNRLSSAANQDYIYEAANRLVRGEGATFKYDRNGNVISRTDSQGTTTFGYDAENRLIEIKLPAGQLISNKYDPLGRRIEKRVDDSTTRYFYDGNDIVLEFDDGIQTLARYTYGSGVDEPLIMERGGQSYFYHADGLGSIQSLTNSAGVTVQTYKYDSFGRILNKPGTVLNPYAFTGREWDSDSELYFYRARFYDPIRGRFLSEDPITALTGRSQYGYVSNNPANRVDPLGLSESPELGGALLNKGFESVIENWLQSHGYNTPEGRIAAAAIAAATLTTVGAILFPVAAATAAVTAGDIIASAIVAASVQYLTENPTAHDILRFGVQKAVSPEDRHSFEKLYEFFNSSQQTGSGEPCKK